MSIQEETATFQKTLDDTLAKNDLKGASVAVRDLLALQRKSDSKETFAKTLKTQADICLRAGDARGALRAGKEALTLAREKKDAGLEAATLQTVANAFLSTDKPENALKAAGDALALVRKEGGKDKEASALTTVAQAHLARGELKSAIKTAEEGLKAFRGLKDKTGEATMLQTLAQAHLDRLPRKDNVNKAMQYAKEASALFKEVGDKKGEAAAQLSVAKGLLKQDSLGEALTSAKSAVALFWEAGDWAGADLADEVVTAAMPAKTKEPDAKAEKPVPAFYADAVVETVNIVGLAQTQRLGACVCVVTGASRGVGKGIAEGLAEAGGIVYVTGRSTAKVPTDKELGGSVDQTATELAKLGGIGVAVHADHSVSEMNKSVASLIQEQHGRLDVLVNNAFTVVKPDDLFFNTPVWNQPMRFLQEQTAAGGFDKGALTLLMLPQLRRGKGFVCNISGSEAQVNHRSMPVSFVVNKGAYDQTSNALAEQLYKFNVSVVTLWPGISRTERNMKRAASVGQRLQDQETTRFTGKAVVELAKQRPEVLALYARRTLTTVDVFNKGFAHECDGYRHEAHLRTFVSKSCA